MFFCWDALHTPELPPWSLSSGPFISRPSLIRISPLLHLHFSTASPVRYRCRCRRRRTPRSQPRPAVIEQKALPRISFALRSPSPRPPIHELCLLVRANHHSAPTPTAARSLLLRRARLPGQRRLAHLPRPPSRPEHPPTDTPGLLLLLVWLAGTPSSTDETAVSRPR